MNLDWAVASQLLYQKHSSDKYKHNVPPFASKGSNVLSFWGEYTDKLLQIFFKSCELPEAVRGLQRQHNWSVYDNRGEQLKRKQT